MNRNLALQIVFVAALIIGALVLLIAMGTFRTNKGPRTLVLQVNAAGGYANITVEAGSLVIKESTTVSTPWQRSVVVNPGEQVFLTASNPSQTGEVSCAIRLNGQDWKKKSIQTPKNGVACAGIVP